MSYKRTVVEKWQDIGETSKLASAGDPCCHPLPHAQIWIRYWRRVGTDSELSSLRLTALKGLRASGEAVTSVAI